MIPALYCIAAGVFAIAAAIYSQINEDRVGFIINWILMSLMIGFALNGKIFAWLNI